MKTPTKQELATQVAELKLALDAQQKPEFRFNPLLSLTPKEKEFLRGILVHETFTKMMNLVQRYRPSSNCQKAGTGERDAFSNDRANFRLGQMQGWDAYEVAIFAVLTDTLPKAPTVEAQYPDSARVDAHWGEIPKQT